MPPAFTLGHILGPVAVATVLNVLAFAMLWQDNRTEMQTGVLPVRFWIVLLGYGVPLLIFALSMGGRSITTTMQLFGAAMGGEAMGAGLVYGLLNAFVWSRGQPMRDRLAPMIGCSAFFAGMAWTLFG